MSVLIIYFSLKYDFGGIIFIPFFLYVFIFSIIKIFRLIFSPKSIRKDIRYRIKIKTKLRIKEKVKIRDRNKDFNRTPRHQYSLIFYKNDHLKSYCVTPSVFQTINKGDMVQLECSKYGKSIIEVTFDEKSIKNSYYDKVQMAYNSWLNYFRTGSPIKIRGILRGESHLASLQI